MPRWSSGARSVVDRRSIEQCLRVAYVDVLGREPDPDGLCDYADQVAAGRSIDDVARELAQSREGAIRAARQHGMALDERADHAFIDDLYREVLGREADVSGRAWLQAMLDAGAPRQAVSYVLAISEESLNRQWAARMQLKDLRELRPASFVHRQGQDGSEHEVFRAEVPEDTDWMESMILEHGYYEKPGIWSLEVDDDKRRMGSLLGAFRPRRALEIGCSSGAVLTSLADLGFHAEGLEISRMAIQRADASVRRRIIQGDLLTVDLQGRYDLVFGLDVFEHLNPNRLDRYLARLCELMDDEGFLFVNSPAFGEDPVYGTVFPLDLQSWREDASAGRLFRELLVDEDGYPAHGHLIWAASTWWTRTFERAGFHRQVAVEEAAHSVYDAEFEAESIARKAFFVFSRARVSAMTDDVVERFQSQRKSRTGV